MSEFKFQILLIVLTKLSEGLKRNKIAMDKAYAPSSTDFVATLPHHAALLNKKHLAEWARLNGKRLIGVTPPYGSSMPLQIS